MKARERYAEWRLERFLSGAFPSKLWVWRMQQRLRRCDGCGKRLHEKHHSTSVVYTEPSVEDPPTRIFCRAECDAQSTEVAAP